MYSENHIQNMKIPFRSGKIKLAILQNLELIRMKNVQKGRNGT